MFTLVYTPFVLPLAVSAAIAVALLVVAWRNWREPVAPWFAATLVALLWWTIGYMFELMAVGLNAKIVWADIEYIGTTLLPLFWLVVILFYTGRRSLPRWLWTLLWGAAVILIVIVFVNPGGLFRGHPTVVVQGSLSALAPDYGPLWRYIGLPYLYGLSLAAVLLLVRGMLHAQRIYARQYAALLVAGVIPLAAGAVYAVGLSPWPDYNPAMAAISVSGVLMAYALFHYRLFDIAPLARDAVIDELADGVVVVDLEGRLRDFNAAARAAFPGLDSAAVGSPVDEVLAIHPAMLDGLRREAAAAGSGQDVASGLVRADVSVMMPGDGARRDFSLGLTPVRSRGGNVVGHALLLHDVTESARLLERLGELTSRDELTGLLSRSTWREDAANELLRARRYGYGVGMLLLDLDQLDEVNDARGTAAGDAVLQAVAGACKRTLRPYDIVGRVGSDEIAAVTPHLVGDELAKVADALRDAVAALEVQGQGTDVHITGCLGVAAAEEIGGLDLASLLNQVEQALRAAKSGGSGSVVCAWEV